MTHSDHTLSPKTFERLREQLATAAALCDQNQLLTLADDLHDAIRRRRAHRFENARPADENRVH